MASLISMITRFATGPQGRQALAKAKDYARRPETKQKIEQVRQRFTGAEGSGSPMNRPSSDKPGTSGPEANGGRGSATGHRPDPS